jgi:glycerate 2-kinase
VDSRTLLRDLYAAALSAVDPRALVARWTAEHVDRAAESRAMAFLAVGKAAVEMARGCRDSLPEAAGLVIAPPGQSARIAGARVLEASHPEPDRSSLAAARAALEFVRTLHREGILLALVSGGASSLLCLPRPGLTLAGKRRRIRDASARGLPILELNHLRTSLSAIKGGGLARATAARVWTLVVSDVPAGEFRTTGSAPTITRRARDRVALLADNGTGLAGAQRRAVELGLRVVREHRALAGEAREAGHGFGRRVRSCRADVLLAGGETTVVLGRRPGRGGRCQELVLGAALEISADPATILAAGSDGIDGNSTNAGAFADGSTVARAVWNGLSATDALARHDTATFFSRLGDTFTPGPTGTNVADWVFALLG